MQHIIETNYWELQNRLVVALKDLDPGLPALKSNGRPIIQTTWSKDAVELITTFFYRGAQICVHRTVGEGGKVQRVWKRTLLDDVAPQLLAEDAERTLLFRYQNRKEIEEVFSSIHCYLKEA